MIGKKVSHYRIIEKLGKGGMGEVYLAEDTRLHRRVALKFLPTHLTEDQEARSRFEREARAAAALNHPNIVTIHEINEHDGQVYIAMEHVDGVTLNEKLAGGTALTPQEATDIVNQACDGLEKAHAADIVHRDLKPENIKIDTDGRVKILDFGLAKLQGVTRLTRESSTPGTIYYMSPEQARGADVDARTDVWSLGVILYEMLAGQPPFRGEFEQAVVYSIINEEPEPVSGLRPDTPPALEAAVTGALKKNPEERFGDVVALRNAVAMPARPTVPAPAPVKPAGSFRWWLATAAVVVVGLAFAAALRFAGNSGTPEYSPPVHRQVTFTGDCGYAAISKDGSYLAYSAGHEGARGIYIKDLRSGSSLCIHTAPRCWVWGWSPDGDHLTFSSFTNDSNMGTYIIPRLGGEPRRIHERPWPYFAWSPDGRRIAHIGVETGTLDLLDLDSSERQTYKLDAELKNILSLDWSPARDELLVQAEHKGSQVFWAFRPDGTGRRMLWRSDPEPGTPIRMPWWSPDGEAVYYFRFSLRGQALWDLMKLRLNDKGVARGDPVVIQHSLQIYGYGEVSATGDGRSLQYTRETSHTNLWLVRIDEDGTGWTANKEQLTSTTTWKSHAEISPDGTKIVFAMSEGEASNIYSLPLDTGRESTPLPTPRQLTYFNSLNDGPAWSPDGSEIVFVSSQAGKPGLWLMDADGTNPRPIPGTVVNFLDGDHITWHPGPDIIYRSTGVRNFLVLDPRTGDQHPLVDEGAVGYIFWPRWSYDGRNIALFWNREGDESPSMDIWVLSLEDNSRRIVAGGLFNPLSWSSDGKWIYALHYGTGPANVLYRIPASGGIPEPYVELPFDEVWADYMSISPDGRSIVYAETISSSDVWIVDNFDPDVR
jgi:Tol biopolymer transport system component